MGKGADLADRFEAANNDFIRKLEALRPEQWAMTCEETGWPVNVTAHHVAESTGALTQIIGGVASGADLPGITSEMLDQINAEHAQRAATVTRDETVQLARTNGAQAVQTLRSLGDEQLLNTMNVASMGGSVSAEWIAENVLIGHIGMHWPMIERAVS